MSDSSTTTARKRGRGAAPSGRVVLLMVLLGCGVSVIFMEIGARVWTTMRWSEGSVEAKTRSEHVRGRFLIAPPNGYRLTPGFRFVSELGREYEHNALGYRSPDFSIEKANDTLRVVMMGASTIYGLSVSDRDTAAVLAQEDLEQALPGRTVEVINAGVPGWTSEDTLRNLDASISKLTPDYVVVMDGRNEMFPQTYNNYVDTYDHFRITDDEVLRLQHAGVKRLFRISRTALLLAERFPGWFGLGPYFENPVFGRIRLENRPSAEALARSSADPKRHRAFEANLRHFVERSRAEGIAPILSTMVFRHPELDLGFLLPEMADRAHLGRVVDRNNEIVRSVSRDLAVPLIEGASLSRAELLTDDCHFNEAGEREFAQLVSDMIVSLSAAP